VSNTCILGMLCLLALQYCQINLECIVVACNSGSHYLCDSSLHLCYQHMHCETGQDLGVQAQLSYLKFLPFSTAYLDHSGACRGCERRDATAVVPARMRVERFIMVGILSVSIVFFCWRERVINLVCSQACQPWLSIA
jgi:hypothetical protein